MSPKTSTLLALVGVLLAGIPLPALTNARKEAPAGRVEEASPATQSTYLSLSCSGSPTKLRLLHEGQELASLSADELTHGWSSELALPSGSPIALEVDAQWPEGSSRQAITLELEPEKGPMQQETLWSDFGSDTLHCLFIFSW